MAGSKKVDLEQFARDVVAALYGDTETGELTGQNTITERSCADFVDAIADIVQKHGLTPPSVK